jgi:hypothetical protein
VADGEDDRGGRGSDCPEVVSEPEHRPIVAYRAEAGIESVGEFPVVEELGTNRNIRPGLVGGTDSLNCPLELGNAAGNFVPYVGSGVECRTIWRLRVNFES